MMKRAFLALAFFAGAIGAAWGQSGGLASPNTVVAGPTAGPGKGFPKPRALVGADLPVPSASTLGGVESLTCVAHNWLNSISIAGVPACAQPAYSDLSGSISGVVNISGTTSTYANAGANTTLSNWTSGSAAPIFNTYPACANDGSHALVYINGTGLQCETLATGGTVQTITAGAGITLSSGATCTTTCTASITQGAALQAAPGTPTGTTSATLVHMGLGSTCTITPTVTGRVRFEIRGSASIGATAATFHVQMRRGTGAAPTNGTAVTGTQTGPDIIGDMVNATGGAGQRLPFSIGGIVTGLTLSTAVWFDAALDTSTGTASIAAGLTCDANEF